MHTQDGNTAIDLLSEEKDKILILDFIDGLEIGKNESTQPRKKPKLK